MAAYSIEGWRIIVLLILLSILFGIWVWVQRGQKKLWLKTDKRLLRVLDQQWLTSQTALFVIEVEEQRYLLARTDRHLAWQPLPQTSCSKKTESEAQET